MKSALKSEALRSIGDKSEPVRNTVGIIVSQIVELELGNWRGREKRKKDEVFELIR